MSRRGNLELQQQFADAGLNATIVASPLFGRGENASKIFQMTIKRRREHRRKPKVEYFEIFPGDAENDVRVIDTSKHFKQVLLTVHEPRRKFIVVDYNFKTGKKREITRVAPDWQRTYLMGMDQAHLFIAELPRRVSTVENAHDVLKPADAKRSKAAKRQGEWFFIPATADEERLIDGPDAVIEHVAAIPGNSRNQHFAEEIVKIEKMVFVRGKITHVDHRTLVLKRWCRVERNLEHRSGSVNGFSRVGWID